jgi:hypothetical protein
MFDALTPATLATPPRKGIGARIVRRLGRMGAALHGVVAGRLRRRPSGPDSPVAPNAGGSTAMPARAPRQPRRRPSVVPAQYHDLAFTEAAFPNLTPAARKFFNTPLEDCDPAMVGLVLEALAEAIAGMMTPQDGMQDARDVFLALSSRLGALTGGTLGTPPETVPAAPVASAPLAASAATGPQAAEAADPAPTGPQAASPDLAGSAPAPVMPPPDGSAGTQGEAAPATAGSDQPAAPPVAQPPSDPALNDAGANTTQAPHDSSAGSRQSRRPSFRGGRRFAAGRFAAARCAAGRFALSRRTIPFHRQNIIACVKRPPRLLCYAACAGPPASAGAPTRRAVSRVMHGTPAWRSRDTRFRPPGARYQRNASHAHCCHCELATGPGPTRDLMKVRGGTPISSWPGLSRPSTRG